MANKIWPGQSPNPKPEAAPFLVCQRLKRRHTIGASMTNSAENDKMAVARLSVASNSALVLAKLLVGLWIGSVAVISEAIHSAVDLVAAFIALFAVRQSAKPADADHPFGHGKFENISGTVEALLIFGAGAWIIYEAVKKLMVPEPPAMPVWGVVVMGVSVIVNIFVSKRLFQVGRRTDSAALLADAWHLRTDIWTSAGVMSALLAIWLGGRFLPGSNLWWIDPVAAIAVATLILKAAWDLTIQSGRDLLDTRLAGEEESDIRAIVGGFAPRADHLHKLRTRKAGAERFVEFHLEVDGRMSVADAHALSHEIAEAIKRKYPQTSINIHIEPRSEAVKAPDFAPDKTP